MRDELLELLKKDAYKKGEYTLSSGKKSEHYVNCKPVTLSGRGLTLASLLMLQEVKTSYVAGLTLGADPLVSGVALVSALENKMVNALIVLIFGLLSVNTIRIPRLMPQVPQMTLHVSYHN